MHRITILALCLGILLAGTSFVPAPAAAAGQDRLSLPKPDITGGKPLMQALAERKSTRTFSDKPIPEQELSNLLWAVFGVNRPSEGLHTAPTARNTRALAVYVALESGVWLYEPKDHALSQALNKDVRSRFGGNAPLVLLYAAPKDDRFAGMHVGSLYQNAGLYCASAGLASVVKATGINALDGELTLPQGYIIYIVQPVGWPR